MQAVLRAKLQTQPAPSDFVYRLNHYHYTKYLCKKCAHVTKVTVLYRDLTDELQPVSHL